MTAVFLQARLASTRLPGKALADLGGQPILVRCMEALRLLPADLYVVLTDNASADTLRPLVESQSWSFFAGDTENVLGRFARAIDRWNPEIIVRATADNPLVSVTLALQLLERQRNSHASYSAFRGGPLGCGVEVVTADALRQADRGDADAYDREHVCPYIYQHHPESFSLDISPVPTNWALANGRVTVDTAQDLAYVRALWNSCYRGKPLDLEDYLLWLKQNPQ